MTIDEMIKVLAAIKQGKPVQFRYANKPWQTWYTGRGEDTVPEFHRYEYRVKPQPREWYLVLNQQGFIEACSSYEAARKVRSGSDVLIRVQEVFEEEAA